MTLEDIIKEIDESSLELSKDDFWEIAEHCEAMARSLEEQEAMEQDEE